MSGNKKNRRSFVVDLMSSAAGVWVAVSGGVGLSALAGGCSDNARTKYGGVQPPDGSTDTGNMPKYGGNPPDQAVVKYGGLDGYNTSDQAVAKPDMGPTVKYGGQNDWGVVDKYGGLPDMGPTVKYGGIKQDGPMMKYGGFKPDSSVNLPKYGGQPKYGGNPA